MKIYFPNYVTRKSHLYSLALKLVSYATREFKFHLNLCAKFSGNSCDLPEFQAFFLIRLLIQKSVFRETVTDQSKDVISVHLQEFLTGTPFC